MRTQTQKELVTGLKTAENFYFTQFELVHEGNYEISDADWNYKDVPHLKHIHQLVEGYCGYMGDDVNCVIIVQKMFGMKFPGTLSIYQSGDKRQTYFLTLFWFVLIVETTYESLGPNRTRVLTTYAIGTRQRLLTLLFPLAKLALKRNYDNLMSGDIPMRERRGELRNWGYTFKGDNKNYSFYETTLIGETNVCPPKANSNWVKHQIPLSSLKTSKEVFIGRADEFGVVIKRNEGKFGFFPRLCPHEGADLSSNCNGHKSFCPWHGRGFSPLLSIDASVLDEKQAELGNDKIKFHFKDNLASVEVRSSLV